MNSESSESLSSPWDDDVDWDDPTLSDQFALLQENLDMNDGNKTRDTNKFKPIDSEVISRQFNLWLQIMLIQIILDLVMVAIGFPANIIVLFVSIYNFHKSKSETILIINLALADLLQLR